MNQIIEWSQGNPGALMFLMSVFVNRDAKLDHAYEINIKLMECTSIRGTNIYVLYNDFCDRDVENKTV